MEEEEKLSLSTSLPELIKQVGVNTRFKAALVSSNVLDEKVCDELIEKNNDQNLVFQLVQKLKRSNQPEGFSKFQGVLRQTGHDDVADVLQVELVKHSQRTRGALASRATENKDTVLVPERLKSGIASFAGNEAASTFEKEVSREDLERLRQELAERLPKRREGKTVGDVIVDAEYYQNVYDFTLKPSASSPGPLPKIDTTQFAYRRFDFRYLQPACCALLSRTLGGKPQLIYSKRKGHSVLGSVDSTVLYCRADILLNPGGVWKCSAWLSVHKPLRETLACFSSWTNFTGTCKRSQEALNLSISGSDWFPHRHSIAIVLSRQGLPYSSLPVTGRRELIHDCLKRSNESKEKVPVKQSYGRRVVAFSARKSDEEPGPFQGPDDKAAAHNSQNIDFISLDLCVMLQEMYGGRASMIKISAYGGLTCFDDMDNNTLFVPSSLHVASGENGKSSIGYFFLSMEHRFIDAIASAIGWYPSRAQRSLDGTMGTDIDLEKTVEAWFKSSKNTGVVLRT